MRYLIIITIFLSLLNASAQAGLHIEPSIGFGAGNVSWTYANIESGTSKGEASVVEKSFSSKIGYNYLNFISGFDLAYNKCAVEIETPPSLITVYNNAGTPLKYQFTGKEVGLFAGYYFAPLRIFATYIFRARWKQEDGTEAQGKGREYKGVGYKLVIGMTPHPNISFNLEYKALRFDKSISTTGATSSNVYDEKNVNFLSISMSIPMDFF